MGNMGKEIEELRTRAEEATTLQSELEAVTVDTTRLKGLYHDEQARCSFYLVSNPIVSGLDGA